MGAFDVTVVGASGEVVAGYPREWGDAPTDSADPVLQLRLLAIRPGDWHDSGTVKILAHFPTAP